MILAAGLLLVVALLFDAGFEHDLWPLEKPLAGVAAATGFSLAAWHHLWYRRRGATFLRVATVAVVMGCLGFSVNAWCYQVGTHVRSGNPARFAYAIGMTSPLACVTWHDSASIPAAYIASPDAANPFPGKDSADSGAGGKEAQPWGPRQPMLELGEADDKYVLYSFELERVFEVPAEDVSVALRPHGLAENYTGCPLRPRN